MKKTELISKIKETFSAVDLYNLKDEILAHLESESIDDFKNTKEGKKK